MYIRKITMKKIEYGWNSFLKYARKGFYFFEEKFRDGY